MARTSERIKQNLEAHRARVTRRARPGQALAKPHRTADRDPDAEYNPDNPNHREKEEKLLALRSRVYRKIDTYDGYHLPAVEDLIAVVASGVETVYIQCGLIDSEYTTKDCVDRAIELVAASVAAGKTELNFKMPGPVMSGAPVSRPSVAERLREVEDFRKKYPFLKSFGRMLPE